MEKDLEQRTKRFSLSVIKFHEFVATDARSGCSETAITSFGDFNWRELPGGEPRMSRADFANKIGTVQKEASETVYWIELLVGSGITPETRAKGLHQESSEALAIFTAIGKKLKR